MALYGVPEIALNSGQKMPVLGLGTGAFPPVAAEVFIQAVLQAIELGYRHFDTASLYQTESTLGTAIEEALRLGLVKSRDELFITSKLWGTDCHPQLVLPTLQKTLRELKLEYLDLFLIHWPISMKPGATEIPPKTFKHELNPYWQQKKLRDYCKANGVTVAAFSPLGAPGNMWGSSRVMESEVLNEIAKAKGKSVAQVCLRWEYEQGIAIVIKSYNKERMKQNLEIFDGALSEEESKKISEISKVEELLERSSSLPLGLTRLSSGLI
ncbi:hypothetical protein TEA_027619 [Camellia sinensis var. sinensis]|uniref:NADP-dependent oxidoreductase domain-containing protein n=1 Tax=Camellia sinensis var. sinensis TaxID=542762 RepID=A0A4S4EWJ2_CAMSN|nr:hypothetical protein TEA_027619 [Camellia sinensis var. sinensis]